MSSSNSNNKDEITMKWAEKVAAQKPWGALGRKFAFYGTLRQGEGNYSRLVARAEGATFEGQRTLPGYKMFSFGGFPFVVPSNNQDDTIIVELFDIPDELIARSIHQMEIGAGYGVDEITLEDQVYWLYIYPSERDYGRFPQVTDGDWVRFAAEQRRLRKEEQIKREEE